MNNLVNIIFLKFAIDILILYIRVISYVWLLKHFTQRFYKTKKTNVDSLTVLLGVSALLDRKTNEELAYAD